MKINVSYWINKFVDTWHKHVITQETTAASVQ